MEPRYSKCPNGCRQKMKEYTSGTETLRLNVCPVVSPLGIYDAELDCLRLVKLFDDALDVFSVAVVPCSENIRFESRDSSLKLGLEKLRAETVPG